MGNDDAIVGKKKPKLMYHMALVAPLAEIFSVSIQNSNNLISKTCEIYGQIRVVDRQGETIDIYERDKDQAESISLGRDGSLLLTASSDPELDVIVALDHVILDVLLFDRAYDTPIVKGEITLDRSRTSGDWEHDCCVKVVKGNQGFSARVEYAIFPYAVVADVSVLFFHKDDHFDTLEAEKVEIEPQDWDYESSDKQDVINYEKDQCSIMANVYGTVTATAASTGKSSILFRTPMDGSVQVKSGDFIELSRSVVAVPAYSTLQIEATFSDHDTMLPIASGIVEFKPRDDCTFKKDIKGENGRVRVRVTWSRAYKHFKVSTIRPVPLKNSESDKSSSDDPEKGHKWRPLPMFEVFSVVVCSKDNKPFTFHGEIHVQDGMLHKIFNKSKSEPQDCNTSGVLALVESGYRGFITINTFSIILNLMDDSGATISFGNIYWMPRFISHFTNRRMCTLIQGERGFAVVHYSMLPRGLSAALDVKLYGLCLPGRVKGKLYARYANFDYSRSYDEKYFQSILYYDETDGVQVDSSGSTLPLVKSKVAVPMTTNLIIVADLSVSPIDAKSPQDVVCLKGCVEVKGKGVGVSSWRIGEDDLYIDVSVEYSEP